MGFKTSPTAIIIKSYLWRNYLDIKGFALLLFRYKNTYVFGMLHFS